MKPRSNLDDIYLAAVARGDIQTAQRMVDAVAKKAGYTEDAYHGSDEDFTEFEVQKTAFGYFFSPDRETADYYTGTKDDGKIYHVYLKMQNPLDLTDDVARHKFFTKHMSGGGSELYKESKYGEAELVENSDIVALLVSELKSDKKLFNEVAPIVGLKEGDSSQEIYDAVDFDVEEILEKSPLAKELVNDVFTLRNPDVVSLEAAYGNQDFYINYQDDVIQMAENNGYDSVILDDPSPTGEPISYVVFNPSQIKSADPITYDSKGNVIPLSKRFNPRSTVFRNPSPR